MAHIQRRDLMELNPETEGRVIMTTDEQDMVEASLETRW